MGRKRGRNTHTSQEETETDTHTHTHWENKTIIKQRQKQDYNTSTWFSVPWKAHDQEAGNFSNKILALKGIISCKSVFCLPRTQAWWLMRKLYTC